MISFLEHFLFYAFFGIGLLCIYIPTFDFATDRSQSDNYHNRPFPVIGPFTGSCLISFALCSLPGIELSMNLFVVVTISTLGIMSLIYLEQNIPLYYPDHFEDVPTVVMHAILWVVAVFAIIAVPIYFICIDWEHFVSLLS